MTAQEMINKTEKVFYEDGVMSMGMAIELDLVSELLEEYAKQESIEFAKWLPYNAVIAEDEYYYLHLETMQQISEEELYNLYLQSKK